MQLEAGDLCHVQPQQAGSSWPVIADFKSVLCFACAVLAPTSSRHTKTMQAVWSPEAEKRLLGSHTHSCPMIPSEVCQVKVSPSVYLDGQKPCKEIYSMKCEQSPICCWNMMVL